MNLSYEGVREKDATALKRLVVRRSDLRSLVERLDRVESLAQQIRQYARGHDELLDCWAEGDLLSHLIAPTVKEYLDETGPVLSQLHAALDNATQLVAAMR